MKQWFKSHRVGEVSSKYGYNPGQFDKDLDARKARSEALWKDFLGWVKEHGLAINIILHLLRTKESSTLFNITQVPNNLGW